MSQTGLRGKKICYRQEISDRLMDWLITIGPPLERSPEKYWWEWLCRWSVSLCHCGFLTMCLLLKHWPLITLLMTCKQVTVYFFPTRKPVPAGFPSMCISPTLLLTFVFTSLDNTSLCLWVPFEKGWVQANLVVTDFAFWKKMNIFMSIWLFSCTVLV